MNWPALVAAISLATAASAQDVSGADHHAWQNWTLNCQGCHRPDASGSPGGAPAMKGMVARFLGAPGGRQYLTRVPGVATAPLSDSDLAEVLDYVLRRFDGADLPNDFQPYTAAEMAAGRKAMLRTNAAEVRNQLIAAMARARPVEGGAR